MDSRETQAFNKGVRAALASERLLACTKAFLRFIEDECVKFNFYDLVEVREYLGDSIVGQAQAVIAEVEGRPTPADDPLLGWPIAGLFRDLDRRDYSVLKAAGIVTFEDLLKRTSADLITVDGFDQWDIDRIANELGKADLELAVPEGPPAVDHPIYGQPFETVLTGATKRVLDVLRGAGIATVQDLLGWDGEELLSLYGFGPDSLACVDEGLRRYGLALAEDAQKETTAAA
ncbi:MAG: hypothetical protein P4L84_32965 [Isosphaeraceae bacterium]|nr:hypothetical protein [Isosphaeraceae bacterium]